MNSSGPHTRSARYDTHTPDLNCVPVNSVKEVNGDKQVRISTVSHSINSFVWKFIWCYFSRIKFHAKLYVWKFIGYYFSHMRFHTNFYVRKFIGCYFSHIKLNTKSYAWNFFGCYSVEILISLPFWFHFNAT